MAPRRASHDIARPVLRSGGPRTARIGLATGVPGALPDVLAGHLLDARPRRGHRRCARTPSTPHVGARRRRCGCTIAARASCWLVASSDNAYAAAGHRVAVGDAEQPAARGLRLDRPQILPGGGAVDPGGAVDHRPAPRLAPRARNARRRGRRVHRAQRPAAARPHRRSRTPALGWHRERPAPRRHASSAASARGHVQLAHRSGRRHRRRAARRADERRLCAAARTLARASCSNARSPSSSGADLADGRRRQRQIPRASASRTLEHPALGGNSS